MPPRSTSKPNVLTSMQRQWLILQQVPVAPAKVSSQTLRERLLGEDVNVSLRTIQRDLRELSAIFRELESDLGTHPDRPGWSWRSSGGIDAARMPPQIALHFVLASEVLRGAIPEPTRQHLDPWVRSAEKSLTTSLGHARWRSRVKVISGRIHRECPAPLPKVASAVHSALLRDRCVAIRFRPGVAKSVAHPLGLLLLDGVSHLIATVEPLNSPQMLPLHTLNSAEVLDVPARRLEGFDLDAFVDGGFPFLRLGDPIPLRLRVDISLAEQLRAAPLSSRQSIEAQEHPWAIVSAVVPDTAAVRGWILGYGERIEVLGPPSLRVEIEQTVRRLARVYLTPPTKGVASNTTTPLGLLSPAANPG